MWLFLLMLQLAAFVWLVGTRPARLRSCMVCCARSSRLWQCCCSTSRAVLQPNFSDSNCSASAVQRSNCPVSPASSPSSPVLRADSRRSVPSTVTSSSPASELLAIEVVARLETGGGGGSLVTVSSSESSSVIISCSLFTFSGDFGEEGLFGLSCFRSSTVNFHFFKRVSRFVEILVSN